MERGSDEEAAANLCRKNHTIFDAATHRDLRKLRTAVEPVYAEIERDAGASQIVKGIEALKRKLGVPPTVIAACSPVPDPTRAGVATEIDGVWTMDTDRTASAPEYYDENWGHWVFVLDHGKFAVTQENTRSCTWGYGTYAVNGTRTAWSFTDGGASPPTTRRTGRASTSSTTSAPTATP